MDENSPGVSSWNVACFHLPDWVMCQTMPVSPELLVSALPTAINPTLAVGYCFRITGRPFTPEEVNAAAAASRTTVRRRESCRSRFPLVPLAKRRSGPWRSSPVRA